MTGYANRERAVDVIYTDSSKTCNTLTHIKHRNLAQGKISWVKTVWMTRLRIVVNGSDTAEADNKGRVSGLSFLPSLSMTGRKLWKRVENKLKNQYLVKPLLKCCNSLQKLNNLGSIRKK